MIPSAVYSEVLEAFGSSVEVRRSEAVRLEPIAYEAVVKLWNRRTGDVQYLAIESPTDNFAECLRRTQKAKVEAGLQGYEICGEVMSLTDEF